jgi:hypothetical protein
MAKLKPNERRANLSFQRPEDVRLYEFLAKRAYEARYEVSTYILVSLHEAFKGQIEEEELNALAEEAAKKVRDRNNPPVEDIPAVQPDPLPAKPQPVSMTQAMQEAEAQIAKLDAIASSVMKKKAGARKVPTPPPMPN